MTELLLVAAAACAAVVVSMARAPRTVFMAAVLATLAGLPVLRDLRVVTLPALLALAAVWGAASRRRGGGGRASRGVGTWAGAALLLAGVSGLGIWLVPLARLAPPTGAFAVGVRDWVVVDSSRAEPFTVDPDDHRVLAVRTWYPVEPGAEGDLPRAAYLPMATAVYGAMARSLGVPPLVVSGAARLRANAREGAPPSGAGPFPVVFYSGGFQQGHQAHNSEVAEELASRGYVVVGVNHPYQQAFTLDAHGTLLTLDRAEVAAAVRAFGAESGGGEMPRRDELLALEPEARGSRLSTYLSTHPSRQRDAALWLADMRSILSRVETGEGPAGAFLSPLVELDRMGVFGMSFGGSTAGLFCATEPRCRAGANLDGTQWGEWFGDGFHTPFLYMSQELSTWNDFWYGGAGPDYHRIRIAGALHGDFTDGFQSTPLTRWAGVLGPIGGERSREILRAYLTAFFGLHLKGEPAPLLEGPAPWPEVDHLRDPLGTTVR